MCRSINKSSLFLIFTLSALSCSLAADEPDQLHVATRKGLYLREAPSRVYLRDEGLYIVTFSFFVEAHGFFIPRPTNSESRSLENGDPSYKHIGNGVYRFRIKG